MSMHDHKVSYELISKLLKSDIKLDLTVLDNEGTDIKTKAIKSTLNMTKKTDITKRPNG